MDATAERKNVEAQQLERVRRLLTAILPANEFYRRKFANSDMERVESLEQFRSLPFTMKSELVEDQRLCPPFGTDLTFAPENYIRIHQTSGTTGHPLYWLDTEKSWEWWADCWKVIFAAAGVTAADRIYFAFSFGPFIGFWAGWEGARKIGALAISGGAQSTAQRLKAIIDHAATVLVCTPTYALHMAAEAKKAGVNLANSAIRITIHAGEPGASIPGTKKMIEESWGAKCFDHPGATEIGAFGFQCQQQRTSVHINEDEFIAEVIDPASGAPVGENQEGELVLTNLGRIGSPVIRYRTGDLVRASNEPCACGRSFLLLQGGVLGRVDDMVIVRGVNVFPSAVENVIREFTEVEEFRIEVFDRDALRELRVIVEPNRTLADGTALCREISQRLRQRMALRAEVESVAPDTLPRFELKARRFFRV